MYMCIMCVFVCVCGGYRWLLRQRHGTGQEEEEEEEEEDLIRTVLEETMQSLFHSKFLQQIH
jgi:hypothetical protein